MNDIYLHHAAMYETMYKTFIDYEGEYRMYRDLLALPHGGCVVEAGCGTGHMYPHFVGEGYSYIGIDINRSMLDIGLSKHPAADLREGDMRALDLEKPADGIFLMSRTLSYMVTNIDLLAAFSSIYKNMAPGGRLAFDVIDASRFIREIHPQSRVEHTAFDGSVMYRRVSRWSPDHSECWTFRWISEYYSTHHGGTETHVITDDSVVRAFTAQDIDLALRLSGYSEISYFEKEAYAFPTLVFRAIKE